MFRVTAYITCTVHIQNSPVYTLTTLAVSVTDRVNAYFTCMHISTGWLGSRVVGVLAGSKIGSSPVKGCGVTAGLAENNGSLPSGL